MVITLLPMKINLKMPNILANKTAHDGKSGYPVSIAIMPMFSIQSNNIANIGTNSR
jgi:hypothetical protein